MGRIIVTAGGMAADVDVLACAVAYAELLRLEGKNAVAVVSPIFTASVTPTILAWGGVYETQYEPQQGDTFVIVDISDPDRIAAFVDRARIVEIYDHHFFGQEHQWYETLGEDAHIEHVGACATLIWEQVVTRGHAEALSQSSKRLLCAAIVSNSLNLTARVTAERDHVALGDLEASVGLPEDWIASYFAEQEHYLGQHLEKLLDADTKNQPLENTAVIVIGQLELWNARPFIERNREVLERTLKSRGYQQWFLSAPSVSEGINYLFTTDASTQAFLAEKLNVTFDGAIATTARLMMRKEIIPLLRA